jgi:hypothetical protein
VLRKSAELEKIAMAEHKAKKSKCPPIGNTEEAEPAAEAPEKPGEMPKPASAAPKPETTKCPPIGNTEEAEPAAPPASEDVGVQVDSSRLVRSDYWAWTKPASPRVDPW